jgi:hypothetical protein
MSVQAANLTFADEAGRSTSVEDLRGPNRAVALFFMRAGTCMVCLRHAKSLAALDLPEVAAVVVVPGGDGEAARVRRTVGPRVRVVSSRGVAAHRAAGLDRTLLLQHSGTLLVDATGAVRYRLAATLPTGSFDADALSAAVRSL